MIWQIAIAYLAIINLVTIGFVWADKRKAKKDHWRIQEKTLFTLGFVGGVWGLLYGMRKFRHKTAKLSFKAVVVLIVLANVAYYYLIWAYLL